MSLLRRRFSTVNPLQGTQLNSVKKSKTYIREQNTLYKKKITTMFSALQSDSQDNPRLHNNKRHPISTFLPATCTTNVIEVVFWTSVVASKCWSSSWRTTTQDEKPKTSPTLPSLVFSLYIRHWPLYVFVLTLYTLTSISIFSILFSVHFKRY